MNRKPLPATMQYSEATYKDSRHKLAHLLNDVKTYEHPDDIKAIQAAITALEQKLAQQLRAALDKGYIVKPGKKLAAQNMIDALTATLATKQPAKADTKADKPPKSPKPED